MYKNENGIAFSDEKVVIIVLMLTVVLRYKIIIMCTHVDKKSNVDWMG